MQRKISKHNFYMALIVFCGIMMACSDACAADFSRDIVRKIQEAYKYLKTICLAGGGLFLFVSMGKIMFEREPQWKKPTIVGFILLLIASFGKIADFFGVKGF